MSDSPGVSTQFLDIRGADQRLELQFPTMIIGRAADANSASSWQRARAAARRKMTSLTSSPAGFKALSLKRLRTGRTEMKWPNVRYW